jgi:hypothetical protein
MNIIGIDPSLTSTGISNGSRHALICTKPAEEDAMTGLRRRCGEIVSGVLRFVGECGIGSAQFFIEAPMLNAKGASHLFDMGFIYRGLYDALEAEYGDCITLVPIRTAKMFIGGNGGLKKDDVKLAVYKRWGTEIPRDPGCDMTHAYVLHKYGEAVLNGEAVVVPIKRRGRGQGKDKKAA